MVMVASLQQLQNQHVSFDTKVFHYPAKPYTLFSKPVDISQFPKESPKRSILINKETPSQPKTTSNNRFKILPDLFIIFSIISLFIFLHFKKWNGVFSIISMHIAHSFLPLQ